MCDEDSARFWGTRYPPVYLQLFAHDGTGWIDRVQEHHYPRLEVMKEHLATVAVSKGQFFTISFRFARSLDDFGYLRWHKTHYSNKYKESEEQWTSNDHIVRSEQNAILLDLSAEFPSKRGNYLYFLVSRKSGDDRVVYVGKADGQKGMKDRFLRNDHDGYIGDCRSRITNGGDKKVFQRIRLKSAELRRRGVERVCWIELAGAVTEAEKKLRGYKLLQIEKAVGEKFDMKDPINFK